MILPLIESNMFFLLIKMNLKLNNRFGTIFLKTKVNLEKKMAILNIPKWRSHLIRQNRATYSNLENHLIQITEPGNPI